MGTEFYHFSSNDWPERFLFKRICSTNSLQNLSQQTNEKETHAKSCFLIETNNNKIHTSKNCSIIHACNKSEKIQINPNKSEK